MTTTTAYEELRSAITRFVDGSYNTAYLMGWCFAHFQPPEGASEDDPAVQLWQFTLLNVQVYARCDMERWMLDQSLRILLQSFDEDGYGCLTPITTSHCFIDMLELDQAVDGYSMTSSESGPDHLVLP